MGNADDERLVAGSGTPRSRFKDKRHHRCRHARVANIPRPIVLGPPHRAWRGAMGLVPPPFRVRPVGFSGWGR